MARYGAYSKKGFKDSRFKLHSVKYFKYLLDNKVIYIKEKAYVSAYDGKYEREEITSQTYVKAIKRGYRERIVDIKENLLEVPAEVLSLFFRNNYQVKESVMLEAIYKAKEAIKYIKSHIEISKVAEYRVFKKVLDFHINCQEKMVV